MPSYSTQITRGGGVFRAALTIEGWPTIYVDSRTLVGNLADGRQRLEALDPKTLRIAASADLLRAELREQEMNVELVDDQRHLVSASLSTRPTVKTWLTTDLGVSDTTATVASTDGFASSGVVHIHTEAIKYTSKSATQFLGLTRGHWGTKAQAHYTADGGSLSFPLVTDRPRSLRGRRCSLALWGSADSSAGNGTERWRGICRTDLEYTGGRWTFSIEPRSFVLDQSIGGDLEEPAPVRGIYLPAHSALSFEIFRHSGASVTDSLSAESGQVRMSGFFPNNEAFVEAVNVALATATGGWTWDADSQLYAESLGSTGWRLVYRCGSSTPYWVRVYGRRLDDGTSGLLSPVDQLAGGEGALWIDTVSRSEVFTVAVGKSYALDVSAPVPRAVLGEPAGSAWWPFTDTLRPQYGSDRLYLGGTAVPSTLQMLGVETGIEGEDLRYLVANAVDASERWVRTATGLPLMLLGPNSRIHIMRYLALVTGLGGLIDALITSSPTYVNAGAMPLITSDDFDQDWTELEAAEGAARLTSRTWVATEGTTLREILVHELRLRGCYIAPDATGQLTIRQLRPPTATDAAATLFTADNVGPALPAVSKNPFGQVGTVVIRQLWDFYEKKHGFPSLTVKNAQTDDPLAGVLEIAPRSRTSLSSPERPEVSIEDAYLLASAVLGMFGVPYEIITLPDVSILHMDTAQIGTVCTVSTKLLPDNDGSFGLTNKPGIVIGYDWIPYAGRGSVTILRAAGDGDVGGYSPGFVVASESGSGTVWTLTLTLSPHTDETAISTWLSVGDKVRTIQRDTIVPTYATGTITAITDPNLVEVTFDASFSAPSEYLLSYDTTDEANEAAASGKLWAQTDFLKIADATRRVALGSGDVPAQVFG